MIISFVVAASENNVIGKNNALPWHLPNDLKFFKNTTWAMPVIMGRKTYESTGKALEGRTNIVITRNAEWKAPDAIVTCNLDQALVAAGNTDAKEAFIIGGGEIFHQAIDRVHKIYITRIHAEFEGDAFFPVIDPANWRQVSNMDCATDQKHQYAYSFQLWERR